MSDQIKLFETEINKDLILPEKFTGSVISGLGGGHLDEAREWTEPELEWALSLRERGLNMEQIAECLNRSLASIFNKLKRHGKSSKKYNEPHLNKKIDLNHKFIDLIKPGSVLDVYSGEKSFYLNKVNEVVANDLYLGAGNEFHYKLDALEFLCTIYPTKKRFDVVDLDPFGSAYDCFDLAIKMANKGLIVTFGEMGHKRFKRLDFVARHYGIKDLNEFTIDALINHICTIGSRNKKMLVPVYIGNWRHISRVYFAINKHEKIYH
jgi:hypothetical protein